MRQSLLRLNHHAARYVRNQPVVPPNPKAIHVFVSKAIGGFMSFWICYRLREDGQVIFVS